MDTELFIYKCIMLLFLESQIPNCPTRSGAMVYEFLGRLDVDAGFGEEMRTKSMNQMKTTALWMAEQKPGTPYDTEELLLRIRINTVNYADLLEIYNDGFKRDYTPEACQRLIAEYRGTIHAQLQRWRLVNIVEKHNRNYRFNPDQVDWDTAAKQLQAALEPLVTAVGVEKNPAIVAEVRTSEPDGISDVIQQGLVALSTEGVLRCAWQGVNRMTGQFGGFRRGELIVTPALQHNYKTGFTLELTRQIAMHNTPYMFDPTKKPLIIHLSTENKVNDNFLEIYSVLKTQETGEAINLVELARLVKEDPAVLEDVTQYVTTHLQRTGYEMAFLQVIPTQFTYTMLVDIVNRYEAMGYEIHLLTIDYLNMFNKTDLPTSGAIGDDSLVLYRSIRNLCGPKAITVITPHQISSEGKKINRQGTLNFAKEATTKNLYSGSSSVDQEVDLEMFLNLERRGDDTYLVIARGKHRKPNPQTPVKDRCIVYKFHPVLGIPEDLDKADTSRREVDDFNYEQYDTVPLGNFF